MVIILTWWDINTDITREKNAHLFEAPEFPYGFLRCVCYTAIDKWHEDFNKIKFLGSKTVSQA